jgi:hypothetical protein
MFSLFTEKINIPNGPPDGGRPLKLMVNLTPVPLLVPEMEP